jgi:2-haloacid dehalogenase
MESYLHLDTFPEVKPALGKLAQYKLAILSNGSPKMLAAAVESAGLKGIFADVIGADEVKIYKSSPRVYGLISQRLGVPNKTMPSYRRISGTSPVPSATGSGPAG